jgi:transcriptional regulator with XRE-family HTH domain
MHMTQNAYLHSLREQKNLSLKEAAHQARLAGPLLYLYERGYLPLPKKKIPALAALYGVSPESFADYLGYPTPLGEEKKASAKTDKLKQAALSWPAFLSVLVLFLTCLGLFIWGYQTLSKAGNETEQAYPQEILSLDDLIRGKGEKDAEGEKYTLTYATESTGSLTITAPSDKRLVTVTAFAYVFPASEGELTLTLTASGEQSIFSFTETDASQQTLYQGSGSLTEDDHYTLETLLNGAEETVEDQTVFQKEATLVASYENKTAPLFSQWAAAEGFTALQSPNSLIRAIAAGNSSLAGMVSLANNLLLYSTLFGVIFLFGSLLLGTLKFFARRKKKVLALAESEPVLPSVKSAVLFPNWKIQPFIPETFFRLAGVSLVLASSILLFRIAHAVLNAEDLFELIASAMGVIDWIKLMPLIPIATTLWFFIRIEILHTSGNVIPTVILSFFLGLLYYFAENAFLLYFQLSSDGYHEILLTLFMSFMPGNLFWGMGCFSLIVLFLLTTPSFRQRRSLVIWRLLALIPVGYLFFSYFYAIGTSLWGWPAWSDDLAGLLFKKELVTTTFAVLYPLALYIYRIIITRKYGQEQASMYFQGNKYFFTKNLLASLILGAMALLSYSLQGSELVSVLGLKQTYWIAVLIPFILFYHPHLGARNHLLDLLFPLAYTVSLGFAYVYIARFILFLA